MNFLFGEMGMGYHSDGMIHLYSIHILLDLSKFY